MSDIYKKIFYLILITALYLLIMKGIESLFTFVLTRDYFLNLEDKYIYQILFTLDSLTYLILIPILFLFMKKLRIRKFEKPKISIKLFFNVILIFFLFRLLEDPISRSNIIFGNEEIPLILNGETRGFFQLLTTILSTIILAPIFEELLFRRIFLGFFNSSNLIIGIIVSSFLFAGIHFNFSLLNFDSLIISFLFGIIASIIYLRHGLLYSILFHSGYNLIWLTLSEYKAHYWKVLGKLDFGILYWLIFLLSFVLIFMYCFYNLRIILNSNVSNKTTS